MRKVSFILICAAIFLFSNSRIFAQKHVLIEPSYAWTIMQPLGLHKAATIDTLFENYAQQFVPSDMSEAYVTTGNYGAPGLNMIIFDRKPMSDFFFRDALTSWLTPTSDQKFYNTRIPMTLLSYNTGGSRDNSQERLSATFSGNAGPRIQIGAMVDYIYSKGCYEYQAAKNLIWGISGSYMGDHYELQTFFNHFNSVNKENGGITDDRYITDPAELQGGSTTINPKSIPTNLTAAHSRVAGKEFYMNHRYKLGFWESLPNIDTIPADTIERRRFIPVISFIWTFDYNAGRHVFNNTNAEQDATFWNNRYISLNGTRDITSYWSIRNTIGISLLEGFNKYAKAGLAAFLTHELRRFNQTPDTIPTSGPDRPAALSPYPFDSPLHPHANEHLLWVGGQLTKQSGSLLRYEATGQVGLVDRSAGDIDLRGSVSLRIPIMHDTLSISGYGNFRNSEVPYLLENYVSNHFIWHNNFNKIRSLRLGGRLDFPKSHTHLDIGVENLQNAVYFNELGLPAQNTSNIQLFSARLHQNLNVGVLHWNNRITYQTSSNDAVIPMPKFAVYSNLFLLFRVAKVLHVQIGVDCDYFTRYYAPLYQPATMTFSNQRQAKVGNYAFMNAYANFKLKRARFYVMMSHVNQGLFGNDYFSMPGYPLNPRRFQMGVSVDFAN